jgi:CubicO group peptidase (beta-lactamase class C family)
MERSALLVKRLGSVRLFACLAWCALSASAWSRSFYDRAFDEVTERYRLPGLAVAVIQNGKVVYRRAVGETIAGSGQRVTPDTLFKIASNSKAMTTSVLARLVDEGKLRWDDPVTRYLPNFRMYDPWVTREIQVRDLLIHNSGLREGAGDLMLWPEPNHFTRADIIAGLAYLKPRHSFRSHYDYDNLLYIVAGEVAAAAGGASYEALLRREVFEPVELTRCQIGEWKRDEVGNVAQPHMRQGERNVVIRADEAVIPAATAAAAGGIRCSLNDLTKWAALWLDPDLNLPTTKQPFLSRAQRDAIWGHHTPLPITRRLREWDHTRFNAYGFGWRISDIDGALRVAHTGTLAGMYSAIVLLPEKKSAFVILINGDGADARTVLSEVLVKHFTAPSHAKSVQFYADQVDQDRRDRVQRAAPDLPAREAAVADSLAPWLGVYRDPWFGEVSICATPQGVTFSSAKSPRLTGPVMSAGGKLLVDWLDDSVDAEPYLTFEAGAPRALKMSKIDPEADFSYDFEDLSFTFLRNCP